MPSTPPNWWNRHRFWAFSTFGRVFSQSFNLAYFELFLGRFSCNTDKKKGAQNTQRSAQIKNLKKNKPALDWIRYPKYNRGGSIFRFLWFWGINQQALMFRFSPPLQRRWYQNSGRCATALRISQMPLRTLTSCDGGRLTKSSFNCFPTLPE